MFNLSVAERAERESREQRAETIFNSNMDHSLFIQESRTVRYERTCISVMFYSIISCYLSYQVPFLILIAFLSQPHFKQLFQLKGNYSGGFGEQTPVEAWKNKKEPSPHEAQNQQTSNIPTENKAELPSEPVTKIQEKIYDDNVMRFSKDFPGERLPSILFYAQAGVSYWFLAFSSLRVGAGRR